MKNVTITLDEALYGWARVEAAKKGMSLSRYVAAALEERREPDLEAELAILDEFFAGPGWPGAAQNWPKRDEIYDRPALLRHERDRLSVGPEGAGETARQHEPDPCRSDTAEARGKPADPQ